MRLIAGSILTGFSLLSLTLGNINIAEGSRRIRPDYALFLQDGIAGFATFILVLGLALMLWSLIERFINSRRAHKI